MAAGKRDHVKEAVRETADNRIEFLRARTVDLLAQHEGDPREAFRSSLQSLQELRLRQKLGAFVYARFYDPAGGIIVESADSASPSLDAVLAFIEGSPKGYPGLDDRLLDVVEIGGRPHVHFVAPVESLEGAYPAGYAQGVFALSDESLAEMRRDLVVSILWVVSVVIATSAVLYPVILTLTRRLASFSERLLESHLETVQILGSAIAKRDSDTSAHNFRVTIMSVRIGEALGLDEREMQRLIKGAYLHDVGKIGITDNILLKPARLDEEEFKVMKTHVGHGVDIVTRHEWLKRELVALESHVGEGVGLISRSSWLDEATDVVGGHHEKYDGSGYPGGLRGEEIPLVARIFAVADVFDALTCKRPYKEPFSFDRSMAILDEGRGSHFDPKVLDAFAALAGEIYRDLANREDAGLKEELEKVTGRYFQAGLESLAY